MRMTTVLVAVLATLACDDSRRTEDPDQPLTPWDAIQSIKSCREVEGEPPCCPDPTALMDFGGNDGATLVCPEGQALTDNTYRHSRTQSCRVAPFGAFVLHFDYIFASADPTTAGSGVHNIIFGSYMPGEPIWNCAAATGRLIGLWEGVPGGACIRRCYWEAGYCRRVLGNVGCEDPPSAPP